MTEDPQIVDTKGLAAHLGCSPSKVRKLVHQKVITPLPKRRSLHTKGRPSMWFDTYAVDKQIADWRARLTKIDNGCVNRD